MNSACSDSRIAGLRRNGWPTALQALLGSHLRTTTIMERRGLTLRPTLPILMRSTGSKEQDDTARSIRHSHAALTEARDIDYTLEAGGSVFGRPQVAVLREAMELLRHESRPIAIRCFASSEEQVRPAGISRGPSRQP